VELDDRPVVLDSVAAVKEPAKQAATRRKLNKKRNIELEEC
jgi:hypothetical protein